MLNGLPDGLPVTDPVGAPVLVGDSVTDSVGGPVAIGGFVGLDVSVPTLVAIIVSAAVGLWVFDKGDPVGEGEGLSVLNVLTGMMVGPIVVTVGLPVT